MHTTYFISLGPKTGHLVIFKGQIVAIPPFMLQFVKFDMTEAEALSAIKKHYPTAEISAPLEKD